MDKKEFLVKNGAYNKNYKKVKNEKFIDSKFFDPMDIAQVKYEMLKEVEKNGVTITEAAEEFGFSRTAFYNIKEAFSTRGIMGLVPEQPGPKKPHKLTEEYQRIVDECITKKPDISSGEIAGIINKNGDININKRTIERYRAKKKPH